MSAARLDPRVGVNSPELVRRLVAANNQRIARHVNADALHHLPSRTETLLRSAFPTIRAEWDSFVERGGALPLTEDLFQGWQGNVGSWWTSGLLVLRRGAVSPLADHFPGTIAAFSEVPGLLSLMWSVLGPGTELPEHRGDNAGGLRLLYGVVCPDGSGHSLLGQPAPVAEGALMLFDDTYPHAAWNHSDAPRAVLLADVLRPLPAPLRWQNVAVQATRHHLTERYRSAASVGAGWHRALNRTP